MNEGLMQQFLELELEWNHFQYIKERLDDSLKLLYNEVRKEDEVGLLHYITSLKINDYYNQQIIEYTNFLRDTYPKHTLLCLLNVETYQGFVFGFYSWYVDNDKSLASFTENKEVKKLLIAALQNPYCTLDNFIEQYCSIIKEVL